MMSTQPVLIVMMVDYQFDQIVIVLQIMDEKIHIHITQKFVLTMTLNCRILTELSIMGVIMGVDLIHTVLHIRKCIILLRFCTPTKEGVVRGKDLSFCFCGTGLACPCCATIS
jgi:hypothetical protein